MKKVLLIGSTPPPMGGIAKWVQRMLNSNLQNGWTLDLVNDGIVGKRESFGDDIKYNIKDEIKRWAGVWYNLFKKARKNDVYVVHACPIASLPSLMANLVSAIVVKICGKKLLIHFRCTVPNMVKTRFQTLILKGLCELSDKIICLNSQTVSYLGAKTKTPTILIPNFVDVKEYAHQISRSSGNIKTVLYVGGVISEKGCDNLVEVAKKLPNIKFRLVGLPSSEITDKASKVENVVMTGVKSGDDLQAEYSQADVFLFLSRFLGEGFSNAVVEAMASGLPCVVTNWAANADQIENEKGGFVVGTDVVNDTVDALNKLSSQDMRKEMGDYNAMKVRNEYSAKYVLSKYVECYEELKNGKF